MNDLEQLLMASSHGQGAKKTRPFPDADMPYIVMLGQTSSALFSTEQ